VILVTGATGTIGRHVVRALAEAGRPVRAMVHDPAKAALLERSGAAEVAVADYAQPASLDAVLAGVDKAFLLPPPSIHQFGFEAKFVDAAKRARLKHVVKLSMIAADPKSPGAIAQWHGMAEKRIEDSGLPFTHLRPNLFMQSLIAFAPRLQSAGRLELPLNGTRVALVDVRDAAAAAAAVLGGDGHEGRIYTITGDAAPTAGEMAASLAEAIGRGVEYVPVAHSDFKRVVLGWGVAEPYADALMSIWHRVGLGTYAAVSDDLPRLIGRRPIGFAEFARDYAHVFHGAAGDRTAAS
jgi:uncharacterized protein YbjT (DUF2867 family)